MIKRLVLLAAVALLAAFCAFAQNYKMEADSAAPAGLPAAFAPLIQPQGYKIVGPKGEWCEVWFRKTIPMGPKPTDDSIVFSIPQGTLIGILSFPAEGSDRRGQSIKPGLYTLRYSDYPVDGAHQGVAPQRDFALMTPIANDSDPNATPAFDALVAMSTKASNTPHPAVLSLESPSGHTFPALTSEGDNNDQVLNVKVGDLPLAIILVGRVQG